MQREFGLAALPPTLIHSARTIRAVARFVRSASRGAAPRGAAPSEGGGEGAQGRSAAPAQPEGPGSGMAGAAVVPREWPTCRRPLSANQEQMWVLQRMKQGLSYNMQASRRRSRRLGWAAARDGPAYPAAAQRRRRGLRAYL